MVVLIKSSDYYQDDSTCIKNERFFKDWNDINIEK